MAKVIAHTDFNMRPVVSILDLTHAEAKFIGEMISNCRAVSVHVDFALRMVLDLEAIEYAEEDQMINELES
jgi:hypothetical protein